MMGLFDKVKKTVGSSKNFEYLDDLIHSGAKEIVLDSDIVLGLRERDKYWKGIKLNVDHLIIDGNGHTINAKGKTNIFDCTGKNILIKNITLKNSDGTAIRNEGELTVTGSTLTGNKADYGGAISNEGELTITKSTLHRNTAKHNGGAIDNGRGVLTITGSIFNNNTAKGDGGAISNEGELIINESIFQKNIANENGMDIINYGRIHSEENISNVMQIYDADGKFFHLKSLNGNQKDFTYINELINAETSEIKLENDIVLNIANNEQIIFKNGIELYKSNLVIDGNGHAIDAQGLTRIFHCKGKNITIKNIILKNGYARNSGAIRNGGELTVTGSTLSGNTAREDGGAIENVDGGSLNIVGCKILSNESSNNIIFNESFMEVHNTKFNNNQSEHVLVNEYPEFNISIIDSEFIGNNVEKDVIFNNGKSCTIKNTIFENNHSRNITNKKVLTLISSEIRDDGQSISNDGHIIIRQSPNLESKIYGKGTVETIAIPPEEKTFDFGYLDKKIHESKTKEIILDRDITFENYEIDYYEGGIELDIDDLVIDGNGHAIDGANKSRIFIITGKNITLRNITLKNGSTHDNYHYHFNVSGGAIRIYHNAKTTFENCKFISNEAYGGGGALCNRGDLTITGSTLTENAALELGGVILNYGSLTIAESTLDNNTVRGSGGAIYNDEGDLTITKSIFTENYAQGFIYIGGTVYDGRSVVKSDDISAAFNGGAICNKDGMLTITESTFTQNKATGPHGAAGGAIYNVGSELTITSSTFTENIASDSGGAIENNEGSLTITKSILNNNAVRGSGGAIENNDGEITITETTLQENTAERDGGAIGNSGRLTITESALTGNTAKWGGAIKQIDGSLTITESVLTGNTAEWEGGAIYHSWRGSLIIAESTLNNNTAERDGGAIYNNRGSLTITESTLTGNIAGIDGGAICSYEEKSLNIKNCKLENNEPNDVAYKKDS